MRQPNLNLIQSTRKRVDYIESIGFGPSTPECRELIGPALGHREPELLTNQETLFWYRTILGIILRLIIPDQLIPEHPVCGCETEITIYIKVHANRGRIR